MEERITSRRNPLLAHTKKLLTSRSYREKTGEFAADRSIEEYAQRIWHLNKVKLGK